jgi:hypothetical protein
VLLLAASLPAALALEGQRAESEIDLGRSGAIVVSAPHGAAEQLAQTLLKERATLASERERRRCACPGCPYGAHNKCSACESVEYCSRACQKLHWAAHKAACKVTSPGSKT